MEQLLALYAEPYAPQRPQLGFAQRPDQLLGEVRAPVPPEPGQPRREDYDEARHGTCTVVSACEPLTGQRSVVVRHTRQQVAGAPFLPALAKPDYPAAQELRVVRDTWSPHTPVAC